MTTSTLTLADFLLARIAEDEAAARTATPGAWKLWGMQVLADQDGTNNIDTAVRVADTYSDEHPRLRTWNANHIARHDPARVLAECEAKRRIVEMHGDGKDYCYSCSGRVYDGRGPCDTLLVLAAIYSDHPDHRQEWTP